MAAQSRDVVEVILPQAFCADHSQVAERFSFQTLRFELRIE